jgi:hypothetical protein
MNGMSAALLATAAALLVGAAPSTIPATPEPSQTVAPHAEPTTDTLPPVAVEVCSAEVQSATNPNLKVGIGFRDNKDVTAVHVSFLVLLMDDQNRVVDTHVVSMDGSFAPNLLILPRRAPITDGLLTQPEYPDSPAWNVPSHFGSPASRVRCVLDAATFADGTMWKIPPQ